MMVAANKELFLECFWRTSGPERRGGKLIGRPGNARKKEISVPEFWGSTQNHQMSWFQKKETVSVSVWEREQRC